MIGEIADEICQLSASIETAESMWYLLPFKNGIN